MKSFPIQTALTLLMLVVLLTLTRMVLPALQLPTVAEVAGIVDFPPERTLISPMVHHADPAPPLPLISPTLKTPQVLLEDDSPSLDHFYAALWRSEQQQPGAVTRILHYGDSPTTADLITGDVRGFLQKRYGDAGHGFVLIGKPWAWYQHAGLDISASGWNMSRASNSESRDGLYGLGGVSFIGAGASSKITYSTLGHRHFEIWYLKQPGGGSITVTADGAPLGEIDTSADSKTPDVTTFMAAASVHALELRATQAPVRVFGVVAEKNVPGVVYDTLGLNGASIHVLSTIMNADHWSDQLRRRHPDLVIVNYGTNEADFGSFIDHGYEGELREAIRRIHAAVPETSILLMSPMDRGHHADDGIETMPTIPRLADIQRRVAHDTGCGFFDTFHAMGGEGTMARWYNGQPRLVSADLIHPTPQGAKLIAVIFAKEISAGLNRYKLRQIQ